MTNSNIQELSLQELESLQGAGWPATKTQYACFVIATAYGFIHPVMGIVAGFACIHAD
jgi:hypothetical protein